MFSSTNLTFFSSLLIIPKYASNIANGKTPERERGGGGGERGEIEREEERERERERERRERERERDGRYTVERREKDNK